MTAKYFSSWFTSNLLTSDDVKLGRLKVESAPQPTIPTSGLSAMGEKSTSTNRPAIQIKANYGFTAKTFPVTLFGGSVTASDSMFHVNTGTDANGVAAVLSEREVTCRAGQGIRNIFSAIFDTPQVNNSQIAGLITSESSFSFGYDLDGDFGVLFARDGALEIQELEITVGATASETATVTIDNIGYSIPISIGGDAKLNAFEIASYLQDNDPRYNFTSNNGTVTCLAKLPELGTGIFTFTSGTATATFTEIQVSSLGVNTWTKKADWNIEPDIDIDPLLGNSYMIQYAYNGFDGVNYFIKDPKTDEFKLVHIIKYGNTDTRPSVKNPIFRIGWAVRNSGNTTSVVLRGSGTAAFNEGEISYDYDKQGIASSALISTNNDDYNVISIRNRRVFSGDVNRAESHVISVILTTDITKSTTFKIYKNAEVDSASDYLDFQYVDNINSLIEVAKNSVIIDQTSVVIGEVTIQAGTPFDIANLLDNIHPGDTLTITASKPSGTADNAFVSVNLQDDL